MLFLPAVQAGSPEPAKDQATAAEEIIEKLKQHYGEKNFTAGFRQESVLPAMDITDTATGRVWFMHPGKMRWAYEHPEAYLIVTDGDNLWIHRPVDNQVVVGNADEFFGDGRGASFLSDFARIQDVFETSLADSGPDKWLLKLTPRKNQADLRRIQMEVDRQTMEIKQVSTENIYGDITRIFFDKLEFVPDMEKGLFDFKIPDGTDVIRMDN